MKRENGWWDQWFLGLAQYVSTASKDPSTQTGAVIVDPLRRVVSIGYNGFPRGIQDSQKRLENRELKYKLIVHCEQNAILFANKSVAGCTLYCWPFGSCTQCAVMVIQAGITRCVWPPCPEEKVERWGEDLLLAETLLKEAGVSVTMVSGELFWPYVSLFSQRIP